MILVDDFTTILDFYIRNNLQMPEEQFPVRHYQSVQYDWSLCIRMIIAFSGVVYTVCKMTLHIEIVSCGEFMRNSITISFFHLFKVVAEAVFTPTEEVQSGLLAPWEWVEKVAKDFFREEWAESPYLKLSMVALEEVVVDTDREEAPEEAEGTLGEAAEIMKMIPVRVEEAPIMLVKDQQNECCYDAAGHGRVIVTYTAVARSDR